MKSRFQFLSALSLLFAFSAYSATATDLSRCDRLLKSTGQYTSIADLPATIEFSVNQEKALAYFQLANDNFSQVLASENLSLALNQPRSPKAQASLKRARKYGQLIRSAFRTFSAGHKAPKSLDRFVTDLGHLNDYIEGKISDRIPKQAQIVMEGLSAIDGANWMARFSPAKKSSVQAFLEGQLGNLREDLRDKKFKAKDFHEIRLILKSLMNLYFFRVAFDDGDESQRVYQFLLQLNEDMGDIHDNLVLRDNRGEINYSSYKLKLPPLIREKISAVLNRIQ